MSNNPARFLKALVLGGLAVVGAGLLAMGMAAPDVRLLAAGLFAWILIAIIMSWLNRRIGLLLLEKQQIVGLGLQQWHSDVAGIERELKVSISKARADLLDSVGRSRHGMRSSFTDLKVSADLRQKDLLRLMLRTFRSLDAGMLSVGRQAEADRERLEILLEDRFGGLESQQRDNRQQLLESLGALESRLIEEHDEAAAGHESLLQEVKRLRSRLASEFSEAKAAALQPLAELEEKLGKLGGEFTKQATAVERIAKGKDIDGLIASSLTAVSRSGAALTLARQLFDHVKPDVVMDIAAMQTLRERAPGVSVTPPMTRFSIEPAAILAVVEDLAETKPALVVELGSGLSTVWIAAALASIGRGRLVSLEHDLHYLNQTRAWLQANGLEEWVDLRLAEVKPCRTANGESVNWYDTSKLEDIDGVDVLLIDGPPQSTGPHARAPALEFLRDKLADGARLFVDDATRGDEKAMVAQWRENDARLSDAKVAAGRMVTMKLRK